MQTPDNFDAVLQSLSDEELLDHLSQSETPELLQAEVRRRLQVRANQELRVQQHAEISRMVEHLEQSRVEWQAVREFFRETLLEFTSRADDPDQEAH
ncbi:MAG: hypothetical protein GX920_08215 [Micrococcus sp.]|nr:hypothetical protein [Micrococcus sp.]